MNIWLQRKGAYWSPRITATPRNLGNKVNKKRIVRLMKLVCQSVITCKTIPGPLLCWMLSRKTLKRGTPNELIFHSVQGT
jgi:hypothetical protein